MDFSIYNIPIVLHHIIDKKCFKRVILTLMSNHDGPWLKLKKETMRDISLTKLFQILHVITYFWTIMRTVL